MCKKVHRREYLRIVKYVGAKYRSQGIGKELMNQCKKQFEKITLEVYRKNIKAINFYEREQFKPIKEEIEETNNEVEILMEWNNN